MTQTAPKLPAWLQTTDQAALVAGHPNRFLIKNLALVQQLLSRLTQPSTVVAHQKQLPGLQLINLLLTVILIVSTHQWLFLWLLTILTLFKLCRLPVQALRPLVKRALTMGGIALCLILPNLVIGQLATTLFFMCRTAVLVCNLAYFLQTTSGPELLLGLRQLHLPNLLILTFDITLKYSHVLAQFLQESLWAIQLRTSRQTKQLVGSLIGRLYLSAKSYINELYQAMLLRGYTGQPVVPKKAQFSWRDWQSLICNVGLFGLLFFIRRSN
ncbi:energy-coupling factor transporter transmembrane component T [Latilactobacillus fuchuensis]|uniref:energy-coupling factor transporter transmembrane component T n=1 Tax=Latilactobacillus fuchuensis TaxID=164393 RepID=UPI0039AEDF65